MNKRLIFLISLPILGFMIFLVIHFSFLKSIEKDKIATENLTIKQLIASDINYEIIKIKSLFFQIPLLSSNQKSLEYNMKLLQKEFQKTQKLFNVLNNGGIYKKKVPLNIVNKSFFIKTYRFKKTKLSIEYIDLLPQLEFLEQKSNIMYKLLKNFYVNKKITPSQMRERRKKIINFARRLDSVFRRMIENSNRLFYESQIQLMKLEKEVTKKTLFYQNLEFSLIIFLILMFVIIGYIVIKELTSLNDELKQKLYIDQLTGVYSRAKLEDIPFNDSSILILIDIDDFSGINELYGIEKGDQILQVIAKKLQTYNTQWQVFRVSSDVFGLYLDDVKKMRMSIESKIYDVREHIMFETITIDDYSIDFNITMGIAFGKDVLHNAFAALNMAKEENLGYKVFHSEEEFKKQIEFNQKWQKEIKYAFAENRIEPFFQAIVDKDKNIVKYESLMRLKKENGEEYISPFFIDIAIKTKQYISISRMMIQKTFEKFKDKGEFSINLNYLDISREGTKKLLEYLIKTYNAQNRVTFEILEDESIKDYNVLKEFVEYFKAFGVQIAIDDFGSGYSNFKRILELNPDYLKFDGSLIKNIDKDSKSYITVKNMVNYAKELNIKTIAEFVHTKDVFDTCLYLGIDYFQGYYIGKPTNHIV